MLLFIIQSLLDYALALGCAVVPWLARSLRSALLVGGLLLGILMSVLGVVLALPLYPWTNLAVLLVALTAGLLVGRGLPPRFGPLLILLAALSVLDVAQIALSGGLVPVSPTSAPSHLAASGPLVYLNFLVLFPAGHYLLGIFDLLVITAVAEHWRRRGGSFVLTLLPGVIGFFLADGAVWLTQLGGWPLIPFFTAGWLCTEAVAHLGSRRLAPAAR